MNRWRLLGLALLVAALLGAQQAFDLTGATGVENVRSFVLGYAPYEPLVFIGVCIGGIVLQLPPLVPIAVGGLLFEGLHAFAYGWVAALAGTTATFLVVRYSAREPVQRLLTRRFTRLRGFDERLERHGFVTVLVLRLALGLTPPLTWALATSRVRLHHFVTGTALGALPGIAAAIFLVGGIARGLSDGQVWTGRTVGAGVVIVAALAAVAIAGRRMLAESKGPRA